MLSLSLLLLLLTAVDAVADAGARMSTVCNAVAGASAGAGAGAGAEAEADVWTGCLCRLIRAPNMPLCPKHALPDPVPTLAMPPTPTRLFDMPQIPTPCSLDPVPSYKPNMPN